MISRKQPSPRGQLIMFNPLRPLEKTSLPKRVQEEHLFLSRYLELADVALGSSRGSRRKPILLKSPPKVA